MNNPFDNVPSTADVPETTDKKTLSSLSSTADRLDTTASRYEAVFKNEEELASVMFETFLDDDGTMKDIAHSAEIISELRKTQVAMDRSCERIEAAQREMPTSLEAHFCEEDRNRLDRSFLKLKDWFNLYPWSFICLGVIVGICIMGSIMVSNSASHKRQVYEHRIKELDNWYQENAEAISFGQFYRENYPKKYREWKSGHWQQDIAYRDSLIRAHSLDRLKHLHED